MTYKYCKSILANGNYVKEEFIDKLDVFLLANRITKEQYQELIDLVNASNDAEAVTE